MLWIESYDYIRNIQSSLVDKMLFGELGEVAKMMKSFVYLIVIIYYVTGVAVSKERIIGGSPVDSAGKFPFIVSITFNGNHICGGFIYNNLWIVTAASCVSGKPASTLKITVGGLNTAIVEDTDQVRNVYSVNIYGQYNSATKVNNLAMLKLTVAIEFNDNVQVIKYNEVIVDTAGTPMLAQIMGWGVDQEGGSASLSLRYATVDIQETSSCGLEPDYPDYQFSTMICASPSTAVGVVDGGSPCQYDEGSPLVQSTDEGTLIAVGILSLTKCTLDTPSVYTRLASFYFWFNQLAGPQL